MKSKRLWLIIGIAILIWITWSETRRGNQYYLGMTAAQAQGLVGKHGKVRGFTIDYSSPPTNQQLTEDVVCHIYDEREGVLLMFNHYDQLVRKKRIKFLGINTFKFADFFRRVF